MSNPARRSLQQAPDDEISTFDYEGVSAFDALDAGEPIYPPRERGSSMLSASLVIIVMMAGGWAVLNAPADWLALLGEKVEAVSALIHNASPASARSDPSSITTGLAAPAPAIETASIADPPALPPDAQAVATPTPPASNPAADATIETAAIDAPAEPQPLPPVHVDPADPYQKRAAAVGLHPDISRVLLKRMSETDYRNARYAIDTAIAKAADDGEFVWPHQRKPEQALFRVHFVAGAAPQCRRYVVTVVKDGWSTTASPMERCGAGITGRKAAARLTTEVSAH